MINMKKMSIMLAALLMVGSFAGCSNKKNTTEEPFNYSRNLTEEGYFEKVKASDLVTLPDYKNISIPADKMTVTDDQIEEQITQIMDQYKTSNQITDVAVKDGDTVNIDYVGSVDGKEFEGGTTGGKGTTVTIGETQYIDDFLQQLIGHKPGETINVEVTFPADYGKDDLNGKDAVFVTKINYIEGEKVTPELNDQFVKEKLHEKLGWSTVAELREGISKDLKKTAKRNYIQTYLTENAKVSEIPEVVLQYHKDDLANYCKTGATYTGGDVNTFIKSVFGVESIDELMTNQADNLKKSAEASLVMQAIAEKEGLKVSEEDLVAYFTENMGAADYSTYEKNYGKPYLNMVVLNDKVLNTVSATATEA